MINFNVRENVTQELSHLAWKLEHFDYPLEQIGELLVGSVLANFDSEGRPDAWEPRVDPEGTWPILNKTGALKGSISASYGDMEVTVDHGTDYGDYLDQGTSRMTARPFLLIQDEDQEAINEIIAQWLSL